MFYRKRLSHRQARELLHARLIILATVLLFAAVFAGCYAVDAARGINVGQSLSAQGL